MQSTSSTYKQLLAAEHDTRYRVLIYTGTNSYDTYGMDYITSLKTSHQLFEGGNPNVGNAIAGQIDLSLRRFISEPPKLAKIVIQIQLYSGSTSSEWLTTGTFFIDTRDRDEYTGEITIHGYDAMLKGEQDIYKDGTYYETWPKSDIEAVNFIASDYLGCSVDPRTTELLTRNYQIEFPGYGDNAITARGLLQYIAGMNGGNFIITPTGALRFVQLNHLPPEPGVLIDENGAAIVFGGYRIIVEDL